MLVVAAFCALSAQRMTCDDGKGSDERTLLLLDHLWASKQAHCTGKIHMCGVRQSVVKNVLLLNCSIHLVLQKQKMHIWLLRCLVWLQVNMLGDDASLIGSTRLMVLIFLLVENAFTHACIPYMETSVRPVARCHRTGHLSGSGNQRDHPLVHS